MTSLKEIRWGWLFGRVVDWRFNWFNDIELRWLCFRHTWKAHATVAFVPRKLFCLELNHWIEAWFIVYLFNMRIPVPVFILALADCYRKFLYPLPQSTTSSISHPSQWHAESYDLLRSYFRKHRKDLRLAQPPKRLFAGVQSWAHGGEDELDPVVFIGT